MTDLKLESTIGFGSAADVTANTAAISALQSVARNRSWVWVNAAARAGQSGLVAADIGKVGYQTDMELEFQLLAVTPAVRWGRLEDGAMAPWAQCNGSQGAATHLGFATNNVVSGTLGNRATTTTTKSTQYARCSMTTAGSAGSTALIRLGSGQMLGCPTTGFRLRGLVVLGAVSASMRWLSGIHDNLAGTNVAANSATRCLSIGAELGTSANLQVFHNDSAGTCTALDLGASFPGGTANSGYLYEFYTADGGTYGFNVLNLNTGAETSGTIVSNIPDPTAQLQHGMYISNNADAAVVALDFSFFQFQQKVR